MSVRAVPCNFPIHARVLHLPSPARVSLNFQIFKCSQPTVHCVICAALLGRKEFGSPGLCILERERPDDYFNGVRACVCICRVYVVVRARNLRDFLVRVMGLNGMR